MSYPIPTPALDDRLAFIGTSGSGKTYNAGVGVERLLATKARVVIVDPLDVWWGLRLRPDGNGDSKFKVVIIGGAHGDLPLTELSGALIGETVAKASESFIISLGGFPTKAAERRFMLAFLTALYRHAPGEPLHLVCDEADLWAPQVILDKDGDAQKLKGQMEQIVRRGRVKGFIPWLITQRPAVLSKDVLSQADGLVAFKLTSSQDRDALGAWIEGQADRAQGKEILASLPGLQQGQGVVWVPGRSVLTTSQFPPKATYDSSRTPKRGEVIRTATPKPLDLGALKDRLATVEAEVKASDPKALKAEVQRLTRALATAEAKTAPTGPDAAALRDVEAAGYRRGKVDGYAEGIKDAHGAVKPLLLALPALEKAIGGIRAGEESLSAWLAREPKGPPSGPAPVISPQRQRLIDRKAVRQAATPRPAAVPETPGDTNLTGPQRHLLTALAWWKSMGHDQPSRTQLAAKAGWTPKGSNLRNRLSELSTVGLVDYPGQGKVRLTDAGVVAAPSPDLGETLLDAIRAILSEPQKKLFEALVIADGGPLTRADLADCLGWEPGGSNLRNRLSELSTLELVAYPSKGLVELQEWVLG